ncbi:MAG TPA: hypothetical protein PLA94_27150 [Myxococcota bacterium]|nr:hypothetical protein [Myxococcota bacterium]
MWLLLLGCARVPGQVQVLNGATASADPRVQVDAAADGNWSLSPNRVEVQFQQIAFEDDARNQRWLPLRDCSATYDLAQPTLAALLDCDFQVPQGEWTALRLKFDPNLAITIDDPVNHLYTDGEGLSSTEPEGGAIPTIVQGQDTIRAVFSEPLVVEEEPVEISVVLNALHTVSASMRGGTGSLQAGTGIQIHASPYGVAEARFLSGGSPLNTQGHASEILVMYEDAQTPSYVFLMPGGDLSACGGEGGFYQAYNTAPGVADENGGRAGGWLAIDPNNTLCFALPTDQTWEHYRAVFQMQHVRELGESTTLACKPWEDPPPPSQGKTWAQGCPDMVPAGEETVVVVAG